MFTHAVLFKIDKKEVKKYHKDCKMWAGFAGKANGFLSYYTMQLKDAKNQYVSVYSWKAKKYHDSFMVEFHDWLVGRSKARVKVLKYHNLNSVYSR
jgi:hypothetical protein